MATSLYSLGVSGGVRPDGTVEYRPVEAIGRAGQRCAECSSAGIEIWRAAPAEGYAADEPHVALDYWCPECAGHRWHCVEGPLRP
jgi:hypothetical protein